MKDTREQLIRLLNENCDVCEVIEGMPESKRNEYCKQVCPIYPEIRRLGKILYANHLPNGRFRGWTVEEEQKLLELSGQGLSYVEIAKKINRTHRSVRSRLNYIKERRRS